MIKELEVVQQHLARKRAKITTEKGHDIAKRRDLQLTVNPWRSACES